MSSRLEVLRNRRSECQTLSSGAAWGYKREAPRGVGSSSLSSELATGCTVGIASRDSSALRLFVEHGSARCLGAKFYSNVRSESEDFVRLTFFLVDSSIESLESTIVGDVAAGILGFPVRGTLISDFWLELKDVDFGRSDGRMVLDLRAVERLSSPVCTLLGRML